MKYLLDSNVLIRIMNDGRSKPAVRVRLEDPSSIGISSVVVHELFYGAFKSDRIQSNVARIEALNFATVEFDWQDARTASEIRADLARRGTPIGPYDAMIAGQAKARGLIVVTHNAREFVRVPGLKIEDWDV